MLKHIVIWDFADGCTKEQNFANAQRIKRELEALTSVLRGVKYIKVIINPLDSSNGDIMLDSAFDSVDALNSYMEHPEHKRVGIFIKAYTKNRRCMDYIE